MQVSFVDIARSYFNARAGGGDTTYVALPPGDNDHEDKFARLVRRMYGKRAAAHGWQEEYSSFLVETFGFAQGTSSPCVSRHPVGQLVALAHGGDSTTAGAKSDLDWYEGEAKKEYGCTIQRRTGPGRDDAEEAIVSNMELTPASSKSLSASVDLPGLTVCHAGPTDEPHGCGGRRTSRTKLPYGLRGSSRGCKILGGRST